MRYKIDVASSGLAVNLRALANSIRRSRFKLLRAMGRNGNLNPQGQLDDSDSDSENGGTHQRPRLICEHCGKGCKNKSGYTQHTRACVVQLEQRLRHPVPQGPIRRDEPDDEDHLNDDDDDNRPAMDLDDGAGSQGGDGEQDEEESGGEARRVEFEYHEGMTGTSNSP